MQSVPGDAVRIQHRVRLPSSVSGRHPGSSRADSALSLAQEQELQFPAGRAREKL